MPRAVTAECADRKAGNPFLDPIVARDRSVLFARFENEDDWTAVDHAALLVRAAQFAALYTQAGIRSQETILVILRPGLNPHAAFLGAMLIGAIPSFMPYPNAKQSHDIYWRQHRTIFETVRPQAVLVYDDISDLVAAACDGLDIVVLSQEAVDALTPIPSWDIPDANAIAFIQYSSGTTGLKKGIPISYAALAGHIHAYRDALRLDETAQTVIATWLPLYHDMGLITGFLLPLLLGVPIISVDPFEWTMRPGDFLTVAGTFRATHIWLPNFALLHHANHAGALENLDLSTVAAIICCSEPCKPAAFDAFLDRFAVAALRPAALQTCYAMAETVFAVTQSHVGTPPRRLRIEDGRELLSNGPPIAGCAIKILDDGEICIKAPWQFAGYQSDPVVFDDGYFRTGDLGFLDGGELFVCGRIKDIIIINGRNIFAHDVEAAVSAHAAVKPGRVVAFGQFSDAQGSEQLILVAETNDAASTAEINRIVLAAVGVACHDIRLVAPGWLIKTTSGKVSRSENKQKYTKHFHLTGGSIQ
jgi:fatty-acyl-CoA synthase